MDRFQRSMFRLHAKNSYLELKRQEFQAWVGRIFEFGFVGDYLVIRLTQGDGGLDGIILSQNAVVAVYAPRSTTNSTLRDKIESDFNKALETVTSHDVQMEKFVFVHNDEGLTKEIGVTLLGLRQSNPDISCEVWTFESLWRLMESRLSEDQLNDLLGEVPNSQEMARLEMPAIRDVVQHLAAVKADPLPLGDITIPDSKKLEYNQLNEYNQHILRGGRSKLRKVAQYFDGMTDPTIGEEIAEGFRKKYAACRESSISPDETFETLWDFAGGNHFTVPSQQAGVTAVISHFFESCDIFENVPES
ncbi:ABC-three component system protein [Aeoliella mucimassa]|uniref:ABC-three component systems C-terminal domain-containing protein n=1 Tax=Aeoliella mucimassa TaxID=2527972 RepID=A0A518AT08_9BACT|nr:ABC-three component system protein [Aeoliella mucimassa]QDU57836.1 hypothetical protein Pan181_40590 [Aeoliella mucimassa]